MADPIPTRCIKYTKTSEIGKSVGIEPTIKRKKAQFLNSRSGGKGPARYLN